MAKINYNKVEQELNQALRSMYVKKLMQGEPSVSKRAVDFYAMDTGPHPKPRDLVVDELEAIEKEELEFERQERERLQHAQLLAQKNKEAVMSGLQAHASGKTELEGHHTEEQTPMSTLTQPEAAPIPMQQAPSTLEREKIPTIEDTGVSLPPLLLLRRLILWMKRKRVIDLYKLLGTTQDEIASLKAKEKLNDTEEQRVSEILERGKQLKAKLLKKLGLQEDQAIVDAESKKHKTKRFNTKDTWLPL